MTANEDERTVEKGPNANGGDPAEAEAEAPAGGSELEAEREKADTYYKNWQRSAADFINYKRRVELERGENARLASAALAINVLPIFDDLDRAVASVDASLAGLNWVQGIIAIHRKFANLMEAMNITEVPAEGERFDPARHEAVSSQPGEDGRVLHVVQKGYQLGDKVIRPAMVIVGEGNAPG